MKDIENLKNIDQKMRNLIWIRDERVCQRCGQLVYRTLSPRGVIHHINFNRATNPPSNLVLLCRRCHSILHNLYMQEPYDYMWERELITKAKCIISSNELDRGHRFFLVRKHIALLEHEHKMFTLPKRDLECLKYLKHVESELIAEHKLAEEGAATK